MPPKRQRTAEDRAADQSRQSASRASSAEHVAAEAAAAAAAEAAAAAATFQQNLARESNRRAQAASRAANAPAVDPAATGAQLDALLDADVFNDDDLDLITTTFERNVSAALAFFSSNTSVAFGTRSAVDMEAQLYDALGDPNDCESAANGVPDRVKSACIDNCMKKIGQREVQACVACGVSHFTIFLDLSDSNLFLDTACRRPGVSSASDSIVSSPVHAGGLGQLGRKACIMATDHQLIHEQRWTQVSPASRAGNGRG